MSNLMPGAILCTVVLSFSAVAGGAESRIVTFQSLYKAGDFTAALDVIRAEIADPDRRMRRDNDYLIRLRLLAIDVLGNRARYSEFQPWMDEEALGYYAELVQMVGGDAERRAVAEKVLATYYSFTHRNGKALPYLQSNLEYWQGQGNTFMAISLLHGIAAVYGDMGELELEKHYRDQVLAEAGKYFRWKQQQPADPNQWLQYTKFLTAMMDDAAKPGGAHTIRALWAIEEPIVQKFINPKSPNYNKVALYLALSGEFDEAKSLQKRALKMARTESARYGEPILNDVTCNDGLISFLNNSYTTASKEIQQCISSREKAGYTSDMKPYEYGGRIFEKLKRWDQAIEYYRTAIRKVESIRSSYSVVERATFFRSNVRTIYWGLIRCLVSKYLETGDQAVFLQALEASETVRGRQFGDLVSRDRDDAITTARLAGFRQGMGHDQVLLAYIATDEDLILFAFSRETQGAYILPGDYPHLRSQVLELTEALATPDSDTKEYQGLLTNLSRRVLAPVQDLLASASRIHVLPDGVLSAIPFDLLTLSEESYRPLISQHVVQVVPSLRYLVSDDARSHVRDVSGLFAVGDPAFSRSPTVNGLTTAQLEAATRGSRFLNYFTPLPETRSEVEGIADLFEGEQVTTLYGATASESEIKRASLSSYRYVHMATHGILGGEVPGLGEPALVLASEADEDGFLTASEVQRLKLNADLAVLSACNTGTGKYFTGEGIMGMGRSFLLAGSRSVLVSLWSVPSKQTEQLMLLFYGRLKAGEAIAEALRDAKLEMMDRLADLTDGDGVGRSLRVQPTQGKQMGGKMPHPFFWAAFVPIGA